MSGTEAVAPQVFCKKGVLRNFTKFTGKHLWACNFIKKETLTQVFCCEFCEISKNTFFHRTPLVAASGGICCFRKAEWRADQTYFYAPDFLGAQFYLRARSGTPNNGCEKSKLRCTSDRGTTRNLHFCSCNLNRTCKLLFSL